MKTLRNLIFIFIVLLLQAGCMHAVLYDGTYRGKIVDSSTREPIEGVVVLGTWSVLHPHVAGGYHTYYDARETVTDKNGEFSIPGQGLRIMSNLEPMSVLIFKVGYQYVGSLGWGSIKIAYSDEIKWEGEKPIFPLKKLTLDERKKVSLPSYPPSKAVRDGKAIRFMEEIKKERRDQGLKVTD